MSIRRSPGQLLASSVVDAKSGVASTGFIRLSPGARIAVAQKSSADGTHDVVGLAFDGNDDVVLGDATAARWITVRSATSGLRVQDPAGMDRFAVDFANGKVAFGWKLDVGNNKIENVAAPTSPADAATKAYVDAMGVSTRSVVLATTAPLSIDGGTSADLSANRTLAIAAATPSVAGSMSASDKAKLDGITAGAAVASVGVTTPVVNTGTAAAPVIGINAATATAAGSMSAADKAKLDGITAGAAVVSVGATAPITSTGGSTPTIGISPANSDRAGSMSVAHYGLVNGATASPTADALARRGASGEGVFGWLAPATTGVATDGFLRLPSTPWQTVIGFDSATSPGNTVRALAIGASNSIYVGDDQTSVVVLNAGTFEYSYPNGDVVITVDSAANSANIGGGVIGALQIEVGTMSVSANGYSYTAGAVGPGVQAIDATWAGQPAWAGDALHGGGFKFTVGAGGGTAKHGGDFTVHLGTADSSGNTGYFKLSETTHADFFAVRHESGGKAVVQAPQGLKFSCALDAGTNRIANLGTPTSSADAATKAYVDSGDALLVPQTRTLTATAPLRIDAGGSADLSTNRTLTISAATGTSAGSMSAADKTKLDGITSGAAVASVSVTAPVVNTGSATAPIIGVSAATGTSAGSMSAADKTKLDGITSGAAVASVSVTAPVVNTGTATAPIIGVNAATATTAGSMSGAHYSLVNGATSSPTASTLATRGASGELVGAWFGPASTTVANGGLLRGPSGNQTVVAIKGSATPSTVALLGVATGVSSTAVVLGDGGTDVPEAMVKVNNAKFTVFDGNSSRSLLVCDPAANAVRPGVSSLSFANTVTGPTVGHDPLTGTGAVAGATLTVQAQQGQQQTSTNTNNNGGMLVLSGGSVGAGGVTGTGAQGSVQINGGGKTLTVNTTGVDVGSSRIVNVATPTASNDAVNKTYVDGKSYCDVQIFNTAGTFTWTMPSGCKAVEVVVIGGSGGGGSGARLTTGTGSGSGGAGGGGGGISRRLFRAADLSSPVTVTVGARGTGGASPTVNGSGIAGADGGTSSFGTYLQATGGKGGGAGLVNANSVGGAGGLGTWDGVAGANGTAGGAGTAGPSSNGASPGGASGGGNSAAAGGAFSGGAGSTAHDTPGTTASGGTVGNPGQSGVQGVDGVGLSGGGGGGSLSVGGNAGTPGTWGAGGSGGGASVNTTSGTGSNGNVGLVIVTAHL